MTQETFDAVDHYINNSLVREDNALRDCVRAAADAGLPPIQVYPAQGKLLMLLARMVGARRILEVGTLAGYSTIWLARGLAPGGHLITLESEPRHAEVAKANIMRAGLSQVAEVRVGRAIEALPEIAASGGAPFDLVFIDADKASAPEYFEWAIRLARVGSIIVMDNVVRDGEIVNGESEDPSVRGMRRFMDTLASDLRVDGTAIQTVGVKGYDGFAVALVVACTSRQE